MMSMEINDMVSYPRKESDLEHRVRELINRVTKSKYISPLEVKYENGTYILRLGLNCKDASPISIGYQGNEEGFFKYLEKEFRKRRLQMVEYHTETLINGNVNLYYPIIEL